MNREKVIAALDSIRTGIFNESDQALSEHGMGAHTEPWTRFKADVFDKAVSGLFDGVAEEKPKTIVAEVSKNWIQGYWEEGVLATKFELVIKVNAERGYELQSWQMTSTAGRSMDIHGDNSATMIETIVAVFTLSRASRRMARTLAESRLFPGSSTYRARAILLKAGGPMHVDDILIEMEDDGSEVPGKETLVSALARLDKKKQIFRRTGKPNTFALREQAKDN